MCHAYVPCSAPSLYNDVANPDLRVVLPVALCALVLLFALEFKYQNLVASIVSGDCGIHARVGQLAAGCEISAVVEHCKDSAEGDLGPRLASQFGNAQ